ncbi:putative pyridoxal reductase [Trichomonascus vanleenenianus]|uniref:aldo/keto reductase family protein n=1 Tax=Trichomonascus vanleenenianus TaxID=2268995 RepID=UPI003ECB882B
MVEILGKQVGATGLGLMSFTAFPERKIAHDDAIKALKAAFEAGATVWNGGVFYGNPDTEENLKLIAEYFEKYPEDAEKVVLSVKGGVNPKIWKPDGSRENIRRDIDTTLKYLDGKKKLDMYCLARIDAQVPLEESIHAIADYIKDGRVGALCLSEVKPSTLKRIHEICPVSAVEIEFSVWEQEAVEIGLMETCAEMNIPVFAYSPLGRGYLGGLIKKRSDVEGSSYTHITERFSEESIEKNWKVVEELQKIASKYEETSAAVALEYIRQKSNSPGFPTIVPIPGTTQAERAVSNTKRVPMTAEDVAELDVFMKGFKVHGQRYRAAVAPMLYQ